jgi:hypothetical protein
VSKKFTVEHGEWLLNARAENQKLLLCLFEFGRKKKNREILKNDPERRALFGLLLGVAYSLWRAAFLSNTERTWQRTFEGADKLMLNLLEDNAVPYSKERATEEWMGGYYLNNAAFRLLWVYKNRHHLAPDTQDHPALTKLAKLDKPGIEFNERSTKVWEVLHGALKVIVPWLSLTAEAKKE